MPTIRDTLAGEHQHCDGLFADAEAAVAAGDWDKADERFAAFRPAMLRHMAVEEEVLFPALEARASGPLGPTAMMRGEHEEMRRLLDAMAQALEAREADELLGLADTLLVLMQQHNLKEEEILYAMADQMLGTGAAGVMARMEAYSG